MVMRYQLANLTVLAVNVCDLAFDVDAASGSSPRSRLRVASWTTTVSSRLTLTLGQQLGKGLQPYVDNRGVVRRSSTEQNLARISQFGGISRARRPDVAGRPGSVVGVSRIGKAPTRRGCGTRARREPTAPTSSAGSVGADQTPGQGSQESLGTARKMELLGRRPVGPG